MPVDANNFISVVIRTRDSARTLAAVFAGLKLEGDDEILIIDSGSTDRTLEIAESHGTQIISAPGPFNYSKSLNLGFHAAKNPWVLVLSSHAIPVSSDFIATHRREASAFPEKVVVGYGPSMISGKSDPQFPANVTTFLEPSDYEKVSRICGNGNSLYRRSAWVECPFDETIRTAEDKIWIMEMIGRGWHFAYVPTVCTLNKNQASLAYMFRKGYSDARTLRTPDHRPMNPLQLAGALKNIGLQRLRGDIDNGNWLRYSAHTFGQFFSSYLPEDNTPRT